MADCTKRILDLSPLDAVECFFRADAWQVIGQNLRRIWTDLSSLTIGEWLAKLGSLGQLLFELALVLAALLAAFASYILPLYFIYLLIRRYALKTPAVFDGEEHKRKNFWGGYLLLSGIILVTLYAYDRSLFLLLQGSWQAICGIAIFLLGSSWWAPLEQLQPATARRWRIVGRTALILTVLVWLSSPIIFWLAGFRPDRHRDTPSQSREDLIKEIKELRRRHVAWPEYAGLRLGMSPDEVISIKGYPPAVLAEVPEDPPPSGWSGPVITTKTLGEKRPQDYQVWAYWNGDRSRIDVTFNPEMTAVIAIRCFSDDLLHRCPSIAGVSDGDRESKVIRMFGSPDTSKIKGVNKALYFSSLGIQLALTGKEGRTSGFFAPQTQPMRVYMLRITDRIPNEKTDKLSE
jgi:hypothetical protein